MRPPLLPDARATQLLGALLLDGEAARAAWARWTAGVARPHEALAADRVMARSLLAMLHDSVRRNALPVDSETLTYLRSAWHTESLRTRAFGEIADDLAARLAGIPFTFVKGAMLARHLYRDPVLRHAHDLEIVTPDPAAVRAALADSPFHRDGDAYVHASGLPLRVHTRLPVPIDDYEPATALDRNEPASTRDHYEPATALALALVHASRSRSRATGRWACDAYLLLTREPIDWPRFMQLVIDARAAVPVHAQLTWLRNALGATVPQVVLDELAAAMPWWGRVWGRVWGGR